MRSTRGSRPKISSLSSISPADLLSRLRTFVFTGSALRLFFGNRGRRTVRLFRLLHRTGRLRLLRERALDRVPYHDPAAFAAGNRAAHHDQPAFDIHLSHFKILRGHAIGTVMTMHFFILEGFARILSATRATKASV